MNLNPMELVLIGVVAVVLFGKKLPEVARSLGKSMAEFRKGVSGFEAEMRQSTAVSTPSRPAPSRARFDDIDDRDEATAPKFEPPAEDTPLHAAAPSDAAPGESASRAAVV